MPEDSPSSGTMAVCYEASDHNEVFFLFTFKPKGETLVVKDYFTEDPSVVDRIYRARRENGAATDHEIYQLCN
ncbi:hypothetical protein HQ520_08490 [bacterium]|nr:hypothetical protein [bacterium]